MDKNEESGISSLFIQTTEDVANAVATAASATTVRSPRPSVVFSSRDNSGNNQLQKLQRRVISVLKGFSPPPEVKKATYNPEILTSQKRQWANFQLQALVCSSLLCFSGFGCPFTLLIYAGLGVCFANSFFPSIFMVFCYVLVNSVTCKKLTGLYMSCFINHWTSNGQESRSFDRLMLLISHV